MAAVRALQASRAFSRVALPAHSRTFSRIAARAPQVLSRAGPSSVRAFSVTARVQNGKYCPPLLFERVLEPHVAVFKAYAYDFSLSMQRPQIC